jgi:hypothetical protein
MSYSSRLYRAASCFNTAAYWGMIGLVLMVGAAALAAGLSDWTHVIVPLFVTCCAVNSRRLMRDLGVHPTLRVPDYAAIASMEREVYGEPFTHEVVRRRR